MRARPCLPVRYALALTPALLWLRPDLRPQTTAQRLAAKHAARQATQPRDPLAAFASDEPTFAQQADGFKDHDALQYWLAEQRKAGGYAKNTLADFAVDMFVAPSECSLLCLVCRLPLLRTRVIGWICGRTELTHATLPLPAPSRASRLIDTRLDPCPLPRLPAPLLAPQPRLSTSNASFRRAASPSAICSTGSLRKRLQTWSTSPPILATVCSSREPSCATCRRRTETSRSAAVLLGPALTRCSRSRVRRSRTRARSESARPRWTPWWWTRRRKRASQMW